MHLSVFTSQADIVLFQDYEAWIHGSGGTQRHYSRLSSAHIQLQTWTLKGYPQKQSRPTCKPYGWFCIPLWSIFLFYSLFTVWNLCTQDIDAQSGFLQNPIIADILHGAWFRNKSDLGIKYIKYFWPISFATLALIFTLVITVSCRLLSYLTDSFNMC